MRNGYLIVASIVVGAVVALTYYLFEAAVRISINAVWTDWLDTDVHRLLIVPLCLVLTVAYFGSVHILDRKRQGKEEQSGLGEIRKPTIKNYFLILGIGYLSLLAGASLGPEAILVPACILVGTLVGTRVFHNDQQMTGFLATAGFVALFTAFFNSFVIGLLSLLLAAKHSKEKITPLLFTAAIASTATSTIVLALIKGHPLIQLPPLQWTLSLSDIVAVIVLLVLGYGFVFLLDKLVKTIERFILSIFKGRPWWIQPIVAALGLTAIYLAAGPLVQFTGNESIDPLIAQSASLGAIGLFLIGIAKIAAIAWSKTLGYRGGLIFPSFFVIATLILLLDHYIEINFLYGLIAVFVGMALADTKYKQLF